MLPDLGRPGIALFQIPARKDNYIYLLHDEEVNLTAAVDPSDAAPVTDFLSAKGWGLDYIFSTHHHHDHTGGNEALRAATGCHVIGFEHDADRIPGIDIRVEEGERVTFGRFSAEILYLPGHTLGHIAFLFSGLKLLFSGDVLFSLGCGRLFEGTAPQMFDSLRKLRRLPGDTWVCCAHEYTEANGRFALTVEPGNEALQRRLREVAVLRRAGEATVPSLLADECAANPFLRADSPEIRLMLDMPYATDAEVFARLRAMKDVF